MRAIASLWTFRVTLSVVNRSIVCLRKGSRCHVGLFRFYRHTLGTEQEPPAALPVSLSAVMTPADQSLLSRALDDVCRLSVGATEDDGDFGNSHFALGLLKH